MTVSSTYIPVLTCEEADVKVKANARSTECIHYLVLDVANSAMLMRRVEDGWTLPYKKHPRLRVSALEFSSDCEEILKQETERMPTCVFLYRAYQDKKWQNTCETARVINVMELLVSVETPAGFKWMSNKDLREVEMSKTFPCTRKVVKNIMRQNLSDAITHRVPWHKPGWFGLIKNWVEMVLKSEGYGAVKRISHVWNRFSTQVLRLETKGAKFYFKATHPVVEEAKLTMWLSKLVPERAPKVLKVDEKLNAMIMEDFSPTHDDQSAKDAEDITNLYLQFGQIQIEILELLEGDPTLLERFPESKILRPNVVGAQLENVLNEEELQGYLEEGELESFRSDVPVWREICAQLEGAGIPCTVVHRDLHTTNFAKPKTDAHVEAKYLIYDWNLGCLSHPFLHLNQMRWKKDVTEKHVEKYLSLWKPYEPDMRKLKRIEKLASMVQPLLDCVDWLPVARKSEAAKRGVILSPDRDSRSKMMKAICERFRQATKSVALYRETFAPDCEVGARSPS